jgi:hypothetical protein
MKELPNGIVIFNATPHVIRFWEQSWEGPVEVGPDEVVNASVVEEAAEPVQTLRYTKIEFVVTKFGQTEEGKDIIERAYEDGADVVVGSIIAAQAYPGWVVAMTPAPGYERVPDDEKRMNPDKFTVFGR